MSDELYNAVKNLLKVKGRHHTEIAYQRLVDAFDRAPAAPAVQEPIGHYDPSFSGSIRWKDGLTHGDMTPDTALYAAPVPAVPPGYALVPIEPTEAMQEAGMNESPLCIKRMYENAEGRRLYSGEVHGFSTQAVAEIYKSMLAAAPQSPVPQGVKDAQRYRWLRSDDIEIKPGQREINVYLERLPFREDQSDELLIESDLDAAIDAAIAAQDAGKGAAK